MKLLHVICVICIFAKMQLISGEEAAAAAGEAAAGEAAAAAGEPAAEAVEGNQAEVPEELEEPEPEEPEKPEEPEEAIPKDDDPPEEDNFAPNYAPPYKSIIKGPAAAEFSLLLGPHVRRYIALTQTRPKEDNMEFNLKVIELLINIDYANTKQLYKTIKKEYPEAEKYFHISKNGFECDSKLCKKFGNGNHGFGVCSPYFCLCDENNADTVKCNKGLVFDPVFEQCDNPLVVKLCGF